MSHALTTTAAAKKKPASNVKSTDAKESTKQAVIKRFESPADPKSLTSLQGNLERMLAKKIGGPADACDLPDEISISYTFNFPEAAEEFKAYFRGDVEVFSANILDRTNKRTQTTVLGLVDYSLRCPFLACAFCIRIDVDSYMYTVPAVVAPLRADADDGFTPANNGASPAPASNPVAGLANAVFDFGTVSNRIAYYLFNFFGVRLELGCNDLITEKHLSNVGFEVNAHLGICANTNVEVLSDFANVNKQLQCIGECDEESVFAGKQVYAPNADGCCGASGAPSLTQSPITSAASGAYNYQGQMAGCIALSKVPVMAGMSLGATIFPLPGQEDKRDEMLEMVTSGIINPSLSNPNVVSQSLIATWTNANPLNIAGPCGTVTITTGQEIPADLLNFVPNGGGGYDVYARWGHAWIGATYVASTTAFVAGTGPYLRTGLTGSAPLPSANLDLETLEVSIGSAAAYRIRAGKLVLTFSIKGSYMSWEDLVAYLSLVGSKNKRLLAKYTAQTEVMQAILKETAEKISLTGGAGVAGIDELRNAIGKQGAIEIKGYQMPKIDAKAEPKA